MAIRSGLIAIGPYERRNAIVEMKMKRGKEMTIVITMTDKGPRSKKAKHGRPKYMTEIDGKPAFYRAMSGLGAVSANRHVFVAPSIAGARAFIEGQCGQLAITDYRIVLYDFEISGPAECVMVAAPHLPAGKGLLIYDIGSVTAPLEVDPGRLCGDGFVVLPSKFGNGKATGAVQVENPDETCRFSEDGGGVYYFKSAALYEQLYYDCYVHGGEPMLKGGRQIAPLYGQLLRQGGTVYSTVAVR